MEILIHKDGFYIEQMLKIANSNQAPNFLLGAIAKYQIRRKM